MRVGPPISLMVGLAACFRRCDLTQNLGQMAGWRRFLRRLEGAADWCLTCRVMSGGGSVSSAVKVAPDARSANQYELQDLTGKTSVTFYLTGHGPIPAGEECGPIFEYGVKDTSGSH